MVMLAWLLPFQPMVGLQTLLPDNPQLLKLMACHWNECSQSTCMLVEVAGAGEAVAQVDGGVNVTELCL